MSNYILCHSSTRGWAIGGELYHHGILGQKWGVRRYQNKDGSLTPEGIKRYQKFDSKAYKEELHKQAAKRGLSKVQTVSYTNHALEEQKSRDRSYYRTLKRQSKVENKLKEANTMGDERKKTKLAKKWIAYQTNLRYLENLDNRDQLDLGRARRDYYLASFIAGPAAAAGAASVKNGYWDQITDAGLNTRSKATSDYELYKKQMGY